MVAADVENAVAAQEIEVGGIIHVIEIGALRPGIDLVETNHPLRRNQGPIQVALVELVVLPQPGGDSFFQVKSHGQWSPIWPSNATLRLPIAKGVERPEPQA